MKTGFVTGATEGQGHLLARKLGKLGWKVFAGVYPGAKTEGFPGVANVSTIDLDVTKTESVTAAAQAVTAALGGAGLDLVLNVAGIANIGVGVLEGANIDDMKRLFDVNTFGQLRVIQAFLPLLRKARPPGRIVNYASGAVLVNPPAAGGYNMSKHAVHGMTLTLRNELASFGIQTTTIMPGGVKTTMTANAHQTTKDMWDKTPAAVRVIYEPSLYGPTTQVLPDMLEKRGSTADEVTDDLLKILKIKKWKAFYTVGKDASALGPMHKLLPERWFDSIMRSTYQIPTYKG
jgi:NAD(P)-dependent dehydrogenase (short-subunit alcohol dehydrogenase family)